MARREERRESGIEPFWTCDSGCVVLTKMGSISFIPGIGCVGLNPYNSILGDGKSLEHVPFLVTLAGQRGSLGDS